MTDEPTDLAPGTPYWSIYLDQAGRKSHYDDRRLVEPWHGEIVTERRPGGLFMVLATDIGAERDLSDARFVIIPHPNSAVYLLFTTKEAAWAAWRRETLAEIRRQFTAGLSLLQRLEQVE